MWFKLKTGIYNLYYFFSVIWNHRWWDYHFHLYLLEKSLEYQKDHTLKFGNHTRSKEDAAEINELIQLLKKRRGYNFYREAEQIIGYEIDTDWTFEKIPNKDCYKMVHGPNHNPELEKKVFDLVHQFEQENWENIWKTCSEKMQNWWD